MPSGTSTTISGSLFYVKCVAGQSGSVDKDTKSHSLIYDVWRDDGNFPDIVDCLNSVLDVIDPTFDGLAANNMSWREDEGTNHFLFTIGYNSQPPESALRWGFDTTGGTVKLTTSQATTAYPATGRTAPDFKGAIGVKSTGKDSEPEGVDIVIPALKLTATYKWPKDTFGIAEAKVIAGLTGRTNNTAFYTFAAGELLFLGATGDITPGVPTEVQYHFMASQNATGLSIGTAISGIAKAGHQYLWVMFEPETDSSAKKLVQRPLAAYVETVYKAANYADLGIGTA